MAETGPLVDPLGWAAALTQAAREINTPASFESTLETIVLVARRSVPDIDEVGISAAHRDGHLETLASTAPLVLELDRLQYDAGEGPCLQALASADTVRVEDAKHEQRWPGFIPAAVRLGLRSQLGICLHADHRTLGALNLYSLSSDVLSEETQQLAELFAAHAALAVGHAKRVHELNAALDSRTTIGVAIGILMHRLDLDQDAAFAYLTRMSSVTETKLRDVAGKVVHEHADRVRRQRAGRPSD
jgi:GAF domain-containing protein